MKHQFKIWMLVMIFMSLFLVGCEKTTSTTTSPVLTTSTTEDLGIVLRLYNEGVAYVVSTNLAYNSVLTLPILEEEGKVFVGWTDGEDVYYGDFTITESISMNAVFENIEDVFSYVVYDDIFESLDYDFSTVYIDKYTGNAKHLVIPASIDGKPVVALVEGAFTGSSVVEVEVPIDTNVGFKAFENALYLEKVTFYGDYMIPYDDILTQDEYDDILQEYSTECTIVSGSLEESQYTFDSGCPILFVDHVTSISVAGVTYTQYYVVMDENLVPNPYRTSYSTYAFYGANNLKTVEIPFGNQYFFADAFVGCPNLETLILDEDHPRFQLIDGVLFDKDGSKMLYYPTGKTDTTYTIPESTLDFIGAFVENTTIETITLPEGFVGDFNDFGLFGLKEIIVENGNPIYYSIDGVLYSDDTLIKYPANKDGSQFVIPEFVSKIGDYAFANNQNLTNLDLGDTLQVIGVQAFLQTVQIDVLHIPSSVIRIEQSCFQRSNIHFLIVHRSIALDGGITEVSNFLGQIFVEGFAIYVSDDSIAEYRQAWGWTAYSDSIFPLSEWTEAE